MGKFIQYRTRESLYSGEFGGKTGWPAAGMGDVIMTDSGRLIAIDGGNKNDAEDFLALLEDKAKGKKPLIDLWIITHPHGDHYGAAQVIGQSPELSARIDVKEFIYWFPMEFKGPNGETGALAAANKEMEEICASFGAKSRVPARDERIFIDEMEIHFVYVPDDCSIFNSSNGNFNLCSLIFTVKGNSKKVMITGDAFKPSMQITAYRYGRALKCDVMQMPHHALCDAYCIDFYRYAAPETVFLPISNAAYRAMHSDAYIGEGTTANLNLEANASSVYKAFEGTAEIDI